MRISDLSSDVCSSDLFARCCGVKRVRFSGSSFRYPVFSTWALASDPDRLVKSCSSAGTVENTEGGDDMATVRAGLIQMALKADTGDSPQAIRDRMNEAHLPLIDEAGKKGVQEIGRAHVCTPATNAQLVC